MKVSKIGSDGTEIGSIVRKILEQQRLTSLNSNDSLQAREVYSNSDLKREKKTLLNQQLSDSNDLRRSYGRHLFYLLIAQVVIADGIFLMYCWIGKNWDVPTSAMQVWLGASVVEAFSITLIVVRSLFPVGKRTLKKLS